MSNSRGEKHRSTASLTSRLERLTAAGDISAARALLRASMRSGNVSGALDGCEVLIVPPEGTVVFILQPISDPPHIWRQQVRSALRWAVDGLDALMPASAYCGSRRRGMEYCGDGSCLGADGGCIYWESARDDMAVRVANLARLLPNPQPLEHVVIEARGHREGTTREIVHPAPGHALRLYIDALRVAKGEGWWRDAFLLFHPSPILQDFSGPGDGGWAFKITEDVPGENRTRVVATVYQGGTVECGIDCPALPRVT